MRSKREFLLDILRDNPGEWMTAAEIARHLPKSWASAAAVAGNLIGAPNVDRVLSSNDCKCPVFKYRYSKEDAI